jgi:hypothetical protein
VKDAFYLPLLTTEVEQAGTTRHNASQDMKTEILHCDYGIYIDHSKAIIVALNEFDRTQEPLVRIELNIPEEENGKAEPETPQAKAKRLLKAFCKKVIDRLEEPHRVVLFGPSEEKYELHKELQHRPEHHHVLKELLVSPQMEQPEEALTFTGKYYTARISF